MDYNLIQEINKDVDEKFGGKQGIFTTPNGISYRIKEPVIYSSSESSSMDEHFKILDYMIMRFCPDISYKQYRELFDMIMTDHDYENGYYGEITKYVISYLKVSDFEAFVWSVKNEN